MSQLINNTDPIFKQTGHLTHDRNTFDLSHSRLSSMLFAKPYLKVAINTCPDDIHRVSSKLRFETPTLGNPLYSDLKLKQRFFHVPSRVCMPNNWEFLITQPLGDNDIPEDALPSWRPYKLFRYLLINLVSSHDNCDFLGCLSNAVYLSRWFGPNSLSSSLRQTIDVLPKFWTQLDTFLSDAFLNAFTVSDVDNSSSFYFRLHELYGPLFANNDFMSPSLIRSVIDTFSEFIFTKSASFYNFSDIDSLNESISQVELGSEILRMAAICGNSGSMDYSESVSTLPYFAYQSVMADYYTDDSVDAVYSWELWLKNAEGLVKDWFNLASTLYFKSNGCYREYDIASKFVFDRVIEDVDARSSYGFIFMDMILGTGRVIKFGDYFTESNVRPLAGTDYGNQFSQVFIPVKQTTDGSSYVDVYDTRKALSMQKFLNICNKVGSRLKDYMLKIFGVDPKDAGCCSSQFLNEISTQLIASNVSNFTNSEITSKIHGSNDGNFVCEYHCTEHGYLIGIYQLDALTSYGFGQDKSQTMIDRYQLFNPAIENLGDQPVLNNELFNAPYSPYNLHNFGYQQRYIQYKNIKDTFDGVFKTNMWQYHTGYYPSIDHPFVDSLVIDSWFIRYFVGEFDRIFSSSVGSTDAVAFHLLLLDILDIKSSRKQNYVPQIM
ncbi:major capsid protein [Capybara microvirus Cap3_SP_333]|nr:major capsid protein [Capybara microvirus Cap3_SP_333]